MTSTRTDTDIRNETSSVLAALNCLPSWILRDGAKDVPEDNSRVLVRECGLDVTSMAVLDAFAAICVYRPFDAYAVTYEVRESKVVLYVASSSTDGVPAEVRSHLERVWNAMKSLAAHPDSLTVRETNTVPLDLKPAHSDFIALLYRFSWPALSHRFRSVADTVIQRLDRVLSCSVERGPLVDGSVELTERERTLCVEIRSALAKARKSVLVDGLGCTNHRDIHAALGDLRVLLKGRDASETLRRVDRLTATALSQEIRSLVWLGVPIDTLRTFAHSQSFAEMCKLNLDILTLEPVTAATSVDATRKELRDMATLVYTDKRMWTPEPNFEAEFAAYILDPLRQRYPAGAGDNDLTNTSAEEVMVPVHAECALLARFASASVPAFLTAPFIRYIGTSEPCCLPCYRYINVVNNAYGMRRMHVRGSDGRIPPAHAWVACEVYSQGVRADARTLVYPLLELTRDYCSALAVLRQHLARVRQAERVSRGEPPLTVEEEQYRDEAIQNTSGVPYWDRDEYI